MISTLTFSMSSKRWILIVLTTEKPEISSAQDVDRLLLSRVSVNTSSGQSVLMFSALDLAHPQME